MLVKIEVNASLFPSTMHSAMIVLFESAAVSLISEMVSSMKPASQLSSTPWKIKVGNSLSHSLMSFAYIFSGYSAASGFV